MKVYTIERIYAQSDILNGAYDNRERAEQKFQEVKIDIQRGRFTHAIGVVMAEWEDGKPAPIKIWYKEKF